MATVFEVSAEIAMFRRPYTTTSSVSYPLPTPTAVAGLISAITGLTNGSEEQGSAALYWTQLKGTRFGMRLLSPLKWRWETINFWNVKNPAKSPHIQVKHQFISRPRYRFYVHGGVEDVLNRQLTNGSFVFTPYLGVAYAIADVHYCGQYNWEPVLEEHVGVSTVVPFNDGMEVDILSSGEIFREKMPYCLSKERSLIKTITILYQISPDKKLHLVKRSGLDVTRCGEDLVAWFPKW